MLFRTTPMLNNIAVDALVEFFSGQICTLKLFRLFQSIYQTLLPINKAHIENDLSFLLATFRCFI